VQRLLSPRIARAAAVACLLLLTVAIGRAADVATQFKEEAARFAKLRADPASINRRDLWKALDARLAKLAAAARTPALRGRILYCQAWADEELAKRSVLDKDYEAAVALYGQAVQAASDQAWADDALLRRATILLETLKRPDEAKADLTRLLGSHPKRDIADRAKSLLAELGKEAPPATTPAKNGQPAPAAPPAPASPAHPATLSQLAVTSTGADTRLTLTLDRETTYRYQLLNQTKAGGEPVKRLYIDLDNTRTGPGVSSEKRFDTGRIARLRAGYFTPDTVRVVLEFDAQQYALQAQNGPFRIMLDLTGPAKAASGRPPEHRAEAASPDGDKTANIVTWLGNVFRDTKKVNLGPTPKETEKASARKSSGEARQPASPPPPDPTPRANFRPSKEQKKRLGDLVEQLGLSVRTIMIDPGHGGKDPGAHGLHGLVEKDVNLRFAKILGEELRQKGFKVLYTRTTDEFIPLETRTELANSKGADLFISVHCNAHSDAETSGLETYSLNLANNRDAVRVAARENASSSKKISDLQAILTDLMLSAKTTESRDLAQYVQKRALADMRGHYATRDRGPHEAPFFVLIGANMPAVLVELGYITNPTEAGRLSSGNYLHALASGLADGIVAYKKKIERFTTL